MIKTMGEYLNKENYIMKFDDLWYRQHLNSTIINQYRNLLGEKCAVLGSNSGYQCYLIGEIKNINEVVGFDINKEALDYGNVIIRKDFPQNIGDKIKFKFSNLKNIDSDDNYFNSIIDFHTLEHIYPEDLNQVISEKYRILKRGGYVILSIPYEKAFHSLTEILPQHVNFFNEDKLKKSFKLGNFEIIECYKDNRIGDSSGSLCLTAIFKKQ